MTSSHGIDENVADEVMAQEESGDGQMETTRRKRLEPGNPAPDFRLPSTQGADVALSDFRGRKHVVLAFLRGMTWPFCRRHVSQLRLGYPKFREQDAEVVVVTATPPERGAKYQEIFKFEYPYLCDPKLNAAKTYGLPINKRSVLGGAVTSGAFLSGLAMTPIQLHTYPQPNELKALVTGQVDGFFVIDKEGIVRFARIGGGTALLPNNTEIEHLLSGLQNS